MNNVFKVFILLNLIISGCSTGYEAVMPFRNLSVSGERLFPAKENDSEMIFRAWINNGTSIDRVITVSYDSLFDYQAKILEFGFLTKKRIFKTDSKLFFHDKNVIPESGYADFFVRLDSLDLIEYSNQTDFDYYLNHQPFSIYVIELKINNQYNCFQFKSHFPDTMSIDSKYQKVERLIFEEFNYEFYMD